ncbi:MAG: type IX secretion system sortase PorU [Sphingobacteriales bacterium]|nr:MAG: type IX secretion system sortase PorU [Sphingobacteriales bacterium]
MMERRISLFILFLLNFLYSTSAFSQQTILLRENLKWQITTKQNNNQPNQQILWFDVAAPNSADPNMPLYRNQVALPGDGTVSIFLEDAIWKPVTDPKLLPLYKDLPAEIDIKSYVKKAGLEPFATAYFVPMRKNPGNGNPEMLSSFTLKINFTPGATSQTSRKKNDVTESVLANGKWQKLGVTETSIYKVDQKYFRSLGFDANTDVRNIKIYGKPGGMLAHANAVARDEDLVENAIQVNDFNNNNILDADDYILFYAKGPVSWTYNSTTSLFRHQANYYADTAYYFITVGNSPGKRITQKSSSAQNSQLVTVFDDYSYHEQDNLTDIIKNVKSGREWFGEEFKSLTGAASIERSFDFNFPEIDRNSQSIINIGVAARAKYPSTFTLAVNNEQKGNISVEETNVDDYLARYGNNTDFSTAFTPNSDKLTVKLTYFKSTLEATGWLDYIELNIRRNLRYRAGQFAFRDAKNTSASLANKYIISGAPGNLQVWDVSNFHDIQKQEAFLQNGNMEFVADNQKINEYIAFDGSQFPSPKNFGPVNNQNLHGLAQADMIILVHPKFMEAAKRLAEMRRTQDGFTVHVVTPQQVYNEFSSGSQDIAAIRDFMRMFYKRAEANGSKKPRYMVLFGDASYDYKYRAPHNTNFIPTWQSPESFEIWGSYCSDDWFGFLDDDEGNWDNSIKNDNLDIAIGRIPVQTLEQAQQMIDKIVEYQDPKAKNPWRNMLTFIADDEDSNTHINQTEDLINKISGETKAFNINKIYFDSYIQESSSSQGRYPAAKREINNDMDAGCLVMNYVGHGGELGLAHEKVVEIPDISSWNNEYKYPVFITATCEFSRFDDPERTSAGELVYLNPKGGAIAMYTTTRVVESGSNARLNDRLMVNNMFVKENGKAKRIGDIFMQGKNATGFDNNTRSFTLLGDPSLRLAIPEYTVVTTKVNSTSVNVGIDTLKALSEATIYGEVHINGAKASNFNGLVYPVIYDKEAVKTTLANDGGSIKRNFNVRENILYKGKATVTNGEFQFSFIVPKDISFQQGFGKLSFYAENQETDAHGYYDSVMVGGSAKNPVQDDKGPEIVLFMNDTLFKFGGLVDENPLLIAKVKDDIGINTSGNGIGHDLTAILNNGDPIILNDYYEANLNNYKQGEIRYPFHKLADGNYTLRVKVWDVSNNSAEATTMFVVASSAKLALDKIFNYPNPFSDQTTFSFEHNRPGEKLFLHISIYAVNGQLIKEIDENINTEGNHVNSVKWDGTNSTGGQISSGMYIYRLTLKTEDGQMAQQSQRLVVIK